MKKLLLFALIASVAHAGDDTVVKGEAGQSLDRAVQTSTRGGFWGSVLVARNGEVLLAKGYGNADYSTKPNAPDSLFEIASVSKMFTAAAILRLESQGKLKTADTLGTLFDGVPDDKKTITVRQLLSHTSGISGKIGLPYAAKETKEELVSKMLAETLESLPGERFEYCNVGYAILAAIVEKVSGQPFEEYVKKEIFEPAGMNDTGFIRDAALDKKRATVRLREGRPDGTAVEWHWSWGYRGMGGVVTTVYDLLRFDKALREGKPLDAGQQKKQATPEREGYGLGCAIDKTPRGTTRISHTGAVAGYRAIFARYLEDGLVVAVLGNEGCEPDAVERALAAVIFPPPSVALSVDFTGVTPKEGVFVSPKGSTWEVSKKDSKLLLAIHAGEAVPARLTFDDESARSLLGKLEAAIAAKTARKREDKADMESGVYTGAYELEEGRLQRSGLSFLVMPKYEGVGRDGRRIEDGRLTLAVVDEVNGFWPVLVKMNLACAKALAKELEAALTK